MVLMRRVGVSVHFPYAFLGSLWEGSGEEDFFFLLLQVDLLIAELIFLMCKSIRLQMFPLGTLPSSGLMPTFSANEFHLACHPLNKCPQFGKIKPTFCAAGNQQTPQRSELFLFNYYKKYPIMSIT